MFEFNFRIAYKSKVQNTKLNSLIKRFENLSKNKNNERHKYNYRIFLKNYQLDKGIRNAIKLTLKLIEESLEENITTQLNFMKKIKAAYFNNVTFQRIMKSKRQNHRRVFKNITKVEVKFELNDCTIINEIFYVKNRLYVLNDEQLQISILKQIYESFSKEHARKTTTYNKVSRHYY